MPYYIISMGRLIDYKNLHENLSEPSRMYKVHAADMHSLLADVCIYYTASRLRHAGKKIYRLHLKNQA
jgi:hypothetical protein